MRLHPLAPKLVESVPLPKHSVRDLQQHGHSATRSLPAPEPDGTQRDAAPPRKHRSHPGELHTARCADGGEAVAVRAEDLRVALLRGPGPVEDSVRAPVPRARRMFAGDAPADAAEHAVQGFAAVRARAVCPAHRCAD